MADSRQLPIGAQKMTSYRNVTIRMTHMGDNEYLYEVPDLGYHFDTLVEAKRAIRSLEARFFEGMEMDG